MIVANADVSVSQSPMGFFSSTVNKMNQAFYFGEKEEKTRDRERQKERNVMETMIMTAMLLSTGEKMA